MYTFTVTIISHPLTELIMTLFHTDYTNFVHLTPEVLLTVYTILRLKAADVICCQNTMCS